MAELPKHGLSEEDATRASVVEIVDEVVAAGKDAVVCTHRPVLPSIFDALGVPSEARAPDRCSWVHLRRGRVIATERHDGLSQARLVHVMSVSERLLFPTGQIEFTRRSPTPP